MTATLRQKLTATGHCGQLDPLFHFGNGARSMQAMRRRFFAQLLGLGAYGVVPAGWQYARAQVDPATMAAAISLAREVHNAFRQGGDIQREFEAVNVRLDAIQANQEALVKALSLMAIQMDHLGQRLANIPAETHGLGLLHAASSLARQLATHAADSRAKPTRTWLSQHELLRQRVLDLSFQLSTAPTIFQYQPSITPAAQLALQALQLLLQAEALPKLRSPERLKHYRYATENLRGAFESMAVDRGKGDNNLPTRIKVLEDRIEALHKDAAKAPYAEYVKLVMPDGLLRRAAADRRRTVQVCLLGPVIRRNISTTFVRDGGGADAGPPEGTITVSQQTMAIVRIATVVEPIHMYGGKVIWDVTRVPAAQWSREAYTQTWRDSDGPAVGRGSTLLTGDPASKIRGCLAATDAESGAPGLQGPFERLLADHAALSALQSRLISFRDRSVASVRVCEALDARLKGQS
jgi:hypothetical protein